MKEKITQNTIKLNNQTMQITQNEQSDVKLEKREEK